MNQPAIKGVVSGPTIQVRSGGYVDLLNPHPDDIHIQDIAHALGKLCRYTGHIRNFYSVAQHSVLCCQNAPPESKWAALMHDAAEAFIGDVSRPLKQLLPEYKAIERRIEAVIFEKFEVVEDENVKRVDREALKTEQRDLMPDTGDTWEPTQGYAAWESQIRPWEHYEARDEFLRHASMHMPDAVREAVGFVSIHD